MNLQRKYEDTVVDTEKNDLLCPSYIITDDFEVDLKQEFAREARVGGWLSGKENLY